MLTLKYKMFVFMLKYCRHTVCYRMRRLSLCSLTLRRLQTSCFRDRTDFLFVHSEQTHTPKTITNAFRPSVISHTRDETWVGEGQEAQEWNTCASPSVFNILICFWLQAHFREKLGMLDVIFLHMAQPIQFPIPMRNRYLWSKTFGFP